MSQSTQPARGGPRAAGLPDTGKQIFPLRMFLVTIASIFAAEIVAMVMVYLIPPLPYSIATLVDAGIMVILIFPILYFLSLRPLIVHIEKLQQVERALHQKEQLQERFFDSIDTLIAYMDREFNFIRVNDAYARAAGQPLESFPGKNHFGLYPHAENQAIFQRVVDTGEAYVVHDKPFEYPDQPERGVTYWNWSLQPVMLKGRSVEGVVLSLVDVTERKRAEQKVEVERARLRSILNTIPDGVYIVNQQYEIEYINPVIERDFGPIRDQKCFDYFNDRDEVCPWCKNPAVFDGRTVRWETSDAKTGKTYEVFETPLPSSDGKLSKLKLMHDITDRKQAAEELERRNRELEALSASERRQRQAAETLRMAAQALAQSLELDVVLHVLLDHLRALIQCDTAGVLFPEGETSLGVRAIQGYEGWIDPNVILSTKVDREASPLLEKLLSTRKGLIVPDVAAEPDWVITPGTEPIRSRLLVPISVDSKLLGLVGLGKFEAGYFTEEHLKWAEALVGQAAVAIQNAWLFEQVRAGGERLQTLSRHLVEIQEKERLYIARELHDQASQTLTSLILGLGMLEKESEASPAIQNRIRGLKNMADHVLEELHRLAVNLRPASLDHLGLTSALEQFIKSFAQDTHLPIRFKAVGFTEDERLPQDVETALYRIVQEALTNVVRHAKASRAGVVLERRGNSMLVIVEDDGKGFEPDTARDGGHLGLVGMQERVEMLGGTLTVESVPGRGTTLFAEVPYVHTDIARG